MAKSDWRAKVRAIVSKGVALVRLTEEQWLELCGKRSGGYRFSLIFPHAVARVTKTDSLALFQIEGGELCVGVVSSVQTVATLDSRVLFDMVQAIVPGSTTELVARLTAQSSRLPTRRLLDGDERISSIPQRLREEIFEQFIGEQANEAAFVSILGRLDRPRRYDGPRALQDDAISLALKAFGAIDGASSVSLSAAGSSLSSARLLEDAVIEHDARWIPGWNLDDSDVTGRAVFTQRNEQLVVYTANRRPLEEVLGVDLIYLNEARGSLIMVQYKMMEPRGGDVGEAEVEAFIDEDDDFGQEKVEEREWAAPIDSQFKDEMNRMIRFEADLSPDSAYRLDPSAFYFKFVRRNAARNSPTLVLSLGHLRRIIQDGEASGPRGGLRVSYEGLNGHYLRGDGFIELIRSGYVGTRGATTDHLTTLIDTALSNRRGVVAAIQSAIKNE